MSREVQGEIALDGGTLYIALSKIRIAVLDATCFRDISKNEVWISRINVPPEYRGRGLGSLLITRLIEQARAQGFKSIAVTPGGYDPDRKDDQIRFYERHGFIKIEGDFYRLTL